MCTARMHVRLVDMIIIIILFVLSHVKPTPLRSRNVFAGVASCSDVQSNDATVAMVCFPR
jgi:hypothetical protein